MLPSKYLIFHIYPSPQSSVSFEREERKACRKDIGHVKEIRARGKNAMKKGRKPLISKTIELLNNGSP